MSSKSSKCSKNRKVKSDENKNETEVLSPKCQKAKSISVTCQYTSCIEKNKDGKLYMKKFLTVEEVYRVFPFLQLSVKRDCKPEAVLVSHLAAIKTIGEESLKIELGLSPPEGVDVEDWFCFLGPYCKVYTQGAGCVDYKNCQEIFGKFGTPAELPEFQALFHSNFVKEKLEVYTQKCKTVRNFDRSLAPLCLLPIESEADRETLKKYFDGHDLPNKKYFACPNHFACRSSVKPSNKQSQNNTNPDHRLINKADSLIKNCS